MKFCLRCGSHNSVSIDGFCRTCEEQCAALNGEKTEADERIEELEEQVEELKGLLREQLIRGQMCHICERVPCKPNCRLRAALEGR